MSATTDSTLNTLSALADVANADTTAPRVRMPVIFVGHGSPMNAIQDNAFTRHLKAWGESLAKPAAIVSISAHWLTPGVTAVDMQENPHTIHDFYGFPQALFRMRYSAPGAPSLARELASMVKRQKVIEVDKWGIDHGTWTVLHHMYPKADIPVFQLSIDYSQGADFHYAMGRELSALRDKGVLILGSGNITHNLRDWDRNALDGVVASRPWTQAFDAEVKSALESRDDKRLVDIIRTDLARKAHPTPDHYFPLLYALGAAEKEETGRSVFEGFQGGTISMRCVQFGA